MPGRSRPLLAPSRVLMQLLAPRVSLLLSSTLSNSRSIVLPSSNAVGIFPISYKHGWSSNLLGNVGVFALRTLLRPQSNREQRQVAPHLLRSNHPATLDQCLPWSPGVNRNKSTSLSSPRRRGSSAERLVRKRRPLPHPQLTLQPSCPGAQYLHSDSLADQYADRCDISPSITAPVR